MTYRELLDEVHCLGEAVLRGVGHVGLPLVHVVDTRVVHSVRALPGEVWSEAERVHGEPDRVLQHLVVREGSVSALVSHDPKTESDGAVGRGIRQPDGSKRKCEWDELVGEKPEPKEYTSREYEVQQGPGRAPLKAVLRDDGHDLPLGRVVLLPQAQGLALEAAETGGCGQDRPLLPVQRLGVWPRDRAYPRLAHGVPPPLASLPQRPSQGSAFASRLRPLGDL